MKKYLMYLLLTVSILGLMAPTAEAKRLGGGGSFGKQSQNVGRQSQGMNRQASPQFSQPTKSAIAPQIPAPKPASPWRGIVGGALLGLGVGSLLSHFGLGGGMGGALGGMMSSIMVMALLAFALIFMMRLFKSKTSQGDQGTLTPFAGGGAPVYTPEIGSRLDSPNYTTSTSAVPTATVNQDAPLRVPADFDVPGFLRTAKTYFIRLQSAWDRADVNDIQEFTTPEMFAELKMQLQERGATPNHTDVVNLDATLLGIETLTHAYLASVQFSGSIKEQVDAPASAFAEVWNLSKPLVGQSGWVLAGIQQLS